MKCLKCGTEIQNYPCHNCGYDGELKKASVDGTL